ncbi:MAG: hypothetical protein RL235_1086 [Chlamydiota bacterium]|jgi:hypothetical protein
MFPHNVLANEPDEIPLQEWLKKEGIPNCPPIRVKCNFGAHETKAHARRLKNDVARAQCVLFEAFGYGEANLQIIALLQSGTVRPQQVAAGKPDDAFLQEILRMVQGRGKFLHPFDARGDHPNYAKHASASNAISGVLQKLQTKPVPELGAILTEFTKAVGVMDESDRFREDMAVRSFRGILKQALKAHPDFLKRKEINVLIVFGGLHEPLIGRLTKKHPDITVDSSIAGPELAHSYVAKLHQALWTREAVDETLNQRAFFEYLVSGIFNKVIQKLRTNEGDEAATFYARAVVDALSLEEWADFYRNCIQSGDATKIKDLAELVKSRGVPVEDDAKRLQQWYRRVSKPPGK